MTAPDSVTAGDLRSLFCERFRCSPGEYEKLALRKCLYFHARIIAPILRLFNPRWFERDVVFIDYFGNAKNLRDVTIEVESWSYQDLVEPRFTRGKLRLRVSGRKAKRLAAKLLPN